MRTKFLFVTDLTTEFVLGNALFSPKNNKDEVASCPSFLLWPNEKRPAMHNISHVAGWMMDDVSCLILLGLRIR